ncbi:hypothetical protein ASG72_15100 [Bosea sp. Leaf344]|uniref:NAD(P)/FAD-dependent oxidoreductase n=1 Tax=Bosea sp. Leaf344 TaxID=1736346 RepID=UPI0006FA7B5F|nr:NAD(P)/FAD-dependent oxidoreductase [Bosea sp. Leaf344]KQU51110.1 hypothetical protein ASG72_15100 [Bosea sp. Leaf344]
MTDLGSGPAFDCVIIGGGPAGKTAALYLARYRRRILLVDDGDSRARLAPHSHNYPGASEGVSGQTLLAALDAQLRAYPVEMRRGLATELSREEAGFAVTVNDRRLAARSILLATGIKDHRPEFEPHDPAVIDGLLRYCPICDGYEGRDQRLCVIGPAEKAAGKALFLRSFTASVTLATTDAADALSEATARELAELGVAVRELAPTRPLLRRGNTLVVSYRTGDSEAFDGVYPALGATPGSALAGALGAEVDEAGCLLVDERYATSVPGLYAAGDVVSDIHQISVAIGHAAVAATSIHNSLPRAPAPQPPL